MKVKPAKKTRFQSKSTSRSVKAKLVRIGNSRGVRIPKSLLEQVGMTDEVTLRVRGESIVIESTTIPRAGWEEAMEKSVARYGNELTQEDKKWLDAPLNTEFDEKEWTW